MNIIDNTIYDNLELLPEDLTGWNGDHKIFKEIITKIRPTVIIEVGTWKGLSAITMGKAIQELSLNTKIYCVDTWLGALEFWHDKKDTEERDLLLKNGYPQIYYQFLSNVVHNKLQDVIIPFPNTSFIGYRYFATTNVKAELIYIDASHDEEDVYNDISNYYNLLKPGGTMFGDDYRWDGVGKAVRKFWKEKDITMDVKDNQFWIIDKQ